MRFSPKDQLGLDAEAFLIEMVNASLANLCLADYVTIGCFTQQVLDEYYPQYSG